MLFGQSLYFKEYNIVDFNGILPPKMKIISSFSHAVPDEYDFLSSEEHKNIFRKIIHLCESMQVDRFLDTSKRCQTNTLVIQTTRVDESMPSLGLFEKNTNKY